MAKLKITNAFEKNSVSMLVFLVAQYLLGMYVAMFAARPEDPAFKTEGLFPKIVFGFHSLVGLGLLVGSVVTLVFGLKNQEEKIKKTAIFAFISIVLAFSAGIATVILKDTAAEITSYVMSAGFLGAFISYGKLFFLLKSGRRE